MNDCMPPPNNSSQRWLHVFEEHVQPPSGGSSGGGSKPHYTFGVGSVGTLLDQRPDFNRQGRQHAKAGFYFEFATRDKTNAEGTERAKAQAEIDCCCAGELDHRIQQQQTAAAEFGTSY
jgi:hypothetical protein